MKAALILFALALPAAAQQADAGVPSDLEQELEKAIKADQGAAAQHGGKGPPAPAPAVSQPTGAAPQTVPRAGQSLNPDISAILDVDSGYQRRAPQFLGGDDPAWSSTATASSQTRPCARRRASAKAGPSTSRSSWTG